MARKTKAEAEKTRRDILRAALDLFYEKGYSKTTFDEIAKRINLTKGAVYWHFRNKPDIVSALIKEAFERVTAVIESHLPDGPGLKTMQTAFVKDAVLIRDNPDYRKFLFFVLFQMEWSEPIFKKIGDSLRDIRHFPLHQTKQALTFAQKSGEISPNINIEETAVAILAFWDGLVRCEISNSSPYDFPTLVNNSFDIVIKGLK